MIFSSASLKRSPRIRTRKNTTSPDTDTMSSDTAHRKTRPPPLQIIPELSENVLDISAAYSPATARPIQCLSQQPELSSRITLSAYTFSIDDALLMFAGDAPRSPALSASSSTSDSEDTLATPSTSDDEDAHDFVLHTPRLRPQRISIRPLCITKTHPLIYQEDEDIHNEFEKEEEKVVVFSLAYGEDEKPAEDIMPMKTTEEMEQDFYARELRDLVCLSPVLPSPVSPARRDSLTLVDNAVPVVLEVPEPKPRGRSRHSKPLPLLPPTTPPVSALPSTPNFSLVQTTAQKSVRRKLSIQPDHLPLPMPETSRPLPRTSVPLDIEDCGFPEDSLNVTSRGTVVDLEEDISIYSQPSFIYAVTASARPLPPAIPEPSTSRMHGDVAYPRSSMDSDAPRSSTDSTSSFASSTSSFSPLSYLSSPPCEERLRSRWSSSTLGSVSVEPPLANMLFSPLRGVFGSRMRRVPLPQKLSPPKLPKNKHAFTLTIPGKHLRQGSRSSTSSAGTSSSDCDSRNVSPSGLKRKPIPVAMFLRAA